MPVNYILHSCFCFFCEVSIIFTIQVSYLTCTLFITALDKPLFGRSRDINIHIHERSTETDNRQDTARNIRHCKKCAECILQNQGQAEKGFSHFDSPDLPMELICMDLVGPIHPPSSQGNKYILTVIDMLTGFTMVVPIPNKSSETICNAYRDHIYCIFGGSSRILTDNGSEFKKKEMQQVCETLGVKHIFSPVYTPESKGSNGCLEGWH